MSRLDRYRRELEEAAERGWRHLGTYQFPGGEYVGLFEIEGLACRCEVCEPRKPHRKAARMVEGCVWDD